jgi:hypothetical protein
MEGKTGLVGASVVVVVGGAWETIMTGTFTVVVVVVGTTSATTRGTSGWLWQACKKSRTMTSGRNHGILRIKA